MTELVLAGQANDAVNLRHSEEASFENAHDSEETIDVEAQTSKELHRKSTIMSILGLSRSCPTVSVRLSLFVVFIYP